MNILDDKKSIITEISVLTSIGKTVEIPDQNYTFPSIDTKSDPIPFMLDLLTATVGSEALQRTVGDVMTKFIRNVEGELKTSLKKQAITFNSDQTLPAAFGAGYQVPLKKIDMFNKLKTDPASSAGSLMYQGNPNSFDKKAYDAILSPGTDVMFGNMYLNYNQFNDQIQFKPVNPSDDIGGFMTTYINSIQLIDEKEFTTSVLDTIYGTTAKATNKPINSLVEEEKIRAILQKLIDGDEIATLTDTELEAIQTAAKNKRDGVVKVDVGCSIIDSSLLLSEISDLISNNLGNSNPLSVGGSYDKLMENSFGKNPTQVNPTNKNAVRDGFFKRLIKTIKDSIVFALTSTPQIRTLMMLLGAFKNGSPSFSTSSLDDINSQRNLIKCLSDSSTALLNEFIFNLLKTELLKITIPVLTLLVREKIQAFVRIIQSLF
jgi:hypothetical protein